ncbi:MAG: transposase [Sandaracinus sp.]|nr:transposase [Sandaracinus sp.]
MKVKRQKYRCGCGGCVETALGPERTVVGGRYSLDFGIDVAVHKYRDHLPLARQVRVLLRSSVVLTSQTLWDQLATLANELEPTYDALLALALREPVISLDRTSWPRLEKGAKDKKPWQMWCVTTPTISVHAICRQLRGTFHHSCGRSVGLEDYRIVCLP